jgi:alpha-1,3-rhamnosyl/mannosyltransferase
VQVDVDDASLAGIYAGAAALVYPSRYEGFGLDPLEALACGCPVVCSKASSLPEIVGDAAILFEPRDEAALADALRQALHDPRPLRQKGPVQAAKFSWDTMAEQTAAVYASMG